MANGVFPVLNSSRSAVHVREAGDLMFIVNLPIEMMMAHERQAVANHGRTVEMLAEAGGLRPAECLAILLDIEFIRPRKSDVDVHRELAAKIAEWRKCNGPHRSF